MGFLGSLKNLFGSRKESLEKKEEKLERKYGLKSGGAVRDDGLVKAGWAITKGRRFYNEDQIYLAFHPLPHGGQEGTSGQVACLAVFDGHGGPVASVFVRDRLFDNLLKHDDFQTNLFKAVEDAYVQTDMEYLKEAEIQLNDDGCTATTAVLVGQRLVVAHVGDSRAVLGEHGEARPLTEDHKPNRPDERERIENVGGTIIHSGTWRVGGVLAVSRSFGNRQLKQFIVPHPEIREDRLHPETSCLIVATDGVWDVVDNDEAVELVSQYEDAEAAARALAVMAYDRGSYDNISCVICKFNFGGSGTISQNPGTTAVQADTAKRQSAAE